MNMANADTRRWIGSYWEASRPRPRKDRQLMGNALFDVAVVGAGYAGLSAALKLAEAGMSVCVLEAEHVGYGASGRNGGFCCIGGTKLSFEELIQRYGLDETRKFAAYQVAGINLVSDRLQNWGIDADRHSDGEVYLAHRPRDFEALKTEAGLLKEKFGIRARLVPKDGLASEGLGGPGFHGAMHMPYGFALNPMAYVQGLAAQARNAGVRIYAHSPVTSLKKHSKRWQLDTEHGRVSAGKVVLAGNGYAREDTPKWLHGRTLPVMSSILVTRPMAEDELAAQGWTSDTMAADTRTLLHYFRLLPDRRFLFGTRGGLFENKAALAAMNSRARSDFEAMFPAWKHVETDYNWYGHVCLSRSRTPFVGEIPELEGVYTAMGWQGSGIAIASISGEKLAGLMTGSLRPQDLPAPIQRPFKRFPVPALRRLYLQAAYWLYGLKDR